MNGSLTQKKRKYNGSEFVLFFFLFVFFNAEVLLTLLLQSGSIYEMQNSFKHNMAACFFFVFFFAKFALHLHIINEQLQHIKSEPEKITLSWLDLKSTWSLTNILVTPNM